MDDRRLRYFVTVVDEGGVTRAARRLHIAQPSLSQALRRDKARTSMLKISELGLVHMTRKRTRESLEEVLTEACPRCEGRRVIKSVATLAAEVMRGIQRAAGSRQRTDMLVAKVNPNVARYLYDAGSRELERAERRLGVKIVLRSAESIEAGAFELSQATAAA